jgi:hypothetical protein
MWGWKGNCTLECCSEGKRIERGCGIASTVHAVGFHTTKEFFIQAFGSDVRYKLAHKWTVRNFVNTFDIVWTNFRKFNRGWNPNANTPTQIYSRTVKNRQNEMLVYKNVSLNHPLSIRAEKLIRLMSLFSSSRINSELELYLRVRHN